MQYAKPTTDREFAAIFQTMVAVVTLEGRQPMVPLERWTIEAIARQIFDSSVDVDAYQPAIPHQLEQDVRDPALRLFFVRLLMTLPFVSGEVSEPQIRAVDAIARRLDCRGEEFSLLERAISRSWNWYVWRLMKHGVDEYWNTNGKATLRDWYDMLVELFCPGFIPDRKVSAKYAALRSMPPETMGGALAKYYVDKQFPLPGEKGGTHEKFALHDFYHIISGYPPEPGSPGEPGSVRGEMLVSVFTGANKVYQPMDWVIVPLLQWHCGAPVITYKRKMTKRNLLDPDAYFHAMRRGMEMRVNLMDKWDWWDHITERVLDVRRNYQVPPLHAKLVGTIDPPPQYYGVDRNALRGQKIVSPVWEDGADLVAA